MSRWGARFKNYINTNIPILIIVTIKVMIGNTYIVLLKGQIMF